MAGEVVFTEKRCSRPNCGKLNWDSETGGYGEDCADPNYAGKKCDTNGEVLKWDKDNNRVY